MRTLSDLTNVTEPAWPTLQAAIERSPTATLLPVERSVGEACLLALQATAASTLGALALHAGAVLIDHGWLRHLGAGVAGLPSLAEANSLVTRMGAAPPPILLVAYDVLGGRFAIDGGGLGGNRYEVHCWGPDALAWASLGIGHTDFVHWSLTGGLSDFYADLRWPGWERESEARSVDQGLSVYPPLCTAESRPIGSTSRRAVPWTELASFLDHPAHAADGPITIRYEP